MTGVLSGIRDRMTDLKAKNIQGLPVFQLSKEQYDALAQDLQAQGQHLDLAKRPALMLYGAKVELK